MSLESLLEAVRTAAEARADEVLERARAEAAEILSAARERARKERDEHRARIEEEARAETRLRLAEVRRDARERVLTARTRGLDRIFDAVRPRLSAATGSEDHRESLPRILSSALEHVEGDGAVVRCSPGLAEALEEALSRTERSGAELEVEEDPAVETGFRIVASSGGLEVDASLDGALRRLRPRLAIELVRRVEGEGALPAATGLESDGSAGEGAGP